MTNSAILRIARTWFAAMALALPLACGGALAQETASASVKLVRVIRALPVGTPWLRLNVSRSFLDSCPYGGVTQIADERKELRLASFSGTFKVALQSAGYKVVTPGEDNLFDGEARSADLEVAAVITSVLVTGCVSEGDPLGERGGVKGGSLMSVDWQVYSPINKQVVAHLSTSASATLDQSITGGVDLLISRAFETNARRLASNLAGSLKAARRPVADAVASVVTVITGQGSGSGDLVSNDGYMVTNAHVVGDEKQVRVRWSDGIETVAEVVRVAKNRDVALIKTNPRDRDPLPIKRGAVTPGARVYAIGSPLGKGYQGTVSSGIISATRVVEGMRYIQSDVSVTHGSSGGALLDENGAMIGITVSGIEGAPGLNFFIPIGDVMDFLALEQQ